MAETKALDDELVGALEPAEKAWVVWDEAVPGFGVRVLPSGARSWFVRFRHVGQDGKRGSRRLVIGRHGEMTVEEARRKASEVLADVASEGEPDGRQEETTAEASTEPDREAIPPPNDAAMEEAPGAGVEVAGTCAVSVTSAGEKYDAETGEILPVGEGEYEDPDGDLGELEDSGQGPDPSREPEAAYEGEADDSQSEVALAGAIAKVTGSETIDRYAEVAETVGRADRSGMPRVGAENATGAERGRDAPGEADAAGGYPDADDDESGAQDRGEGEERAGETETTAPEPGRTRRGIDIAKGMAGNAFKRGRRMASGSRKGDPAKEERAEAAGDEPETGPSASRESRTDEEDGSGGSGEPKLDARRKRDAEAEEETRAGNTLSEESVANLAENLDGIRGVVDRIEAWSAKMGPQMEMLSGSTAVIAVDRRQGRRRVARAVLALAVMTALGLAGGAVMQSRLEVLPQADPTLGWKDHVWDYYGKAFMGCFERARETGTGRAKCEMEVRAR